LIGVTGPSSNSLGKIDENLFSKNSEGCYTSEESLLTTIGGLLRFLEEISPLEDGSVINNTSKTKRTHPEELLAKRSFTKLQVRKQNHEKV
jgi:hypothetical protein